MNGTATHEQSGGFGGTVLLVDVVGEKFEEGGSGEPSQLSRRSGARYNTTQESERANNSELIMASELSPCVRIVPNNTQNHTSSAEDDPPLDMDSKLEQSTDHCHAALLGPGGTGADMSTNIRAQKQLIFAAAVCLIFMIGEFVGGYLSHSLAIMTDAAHLLSDFTSFLISLFALWIARRPPTARMSFGYFRAEVLGAVISVLTIWLATGVLVYLAIMRCINQDYEINGEIMLITAGSGLGINILLAAVLHFTGHSHSHGGLGGGGGHGHSHSHNGDHESNTPYQTLQEDRDDQPLSIQADPIRIVDADTDEELNPAKPKKSEGNMNVRAAFIHILGDLIQSVGVCIAAVIILVEPEYKIADPICTFIFSVLVLVTTILILRDAIQVLMEGVPKHINIKNLRADLKSLPHVRMAHGLHVWSLTTNQAAMAVHLCVDAGTDSEQVLQEASHLIRNKYNIVFSTIQVEHYKPDIMNNCGRCREPTI
ncbi:proton-coupled zinc antiporter SLC30A2-like [Asterias amurensis]|uniref:proton-coupled zinc antiporter SLC30A2-like n=1 Tax=Asterias amurensis TaxID=7602 RepID=UPI003AB5384E